MLYLQQNLNIFILYQISQMHLYMCIYLSLSALFPKICATTTRQGINYFFNHNHRPQISSIFCFCLGRHDFSGSSVLAPRALPLWATAKVSDQGTPRKRATTHSRNFFQGSYDMPKLCRYYPPLGSFVTRYPNPAANTRVKSCRETIDFSDPAAVRALNTALLVADYGILPSFSDIMPPHALVPPIPGKKFEDDFYFTMLVIL